MRIVQAQRPGGTPTTGGGAAPSGPTGPSGPAEPVQPGAAEGAGGAGEGPLRRNPEPSRQETVGSPRPQQSIPQGQAGQRRA